MSFTITPKGPTPSVNDTKVAQPKETARDRALKVLMQGPPPGVQGQPIAPEQAGDILAASQPESEPEAQNHAVEGNDSPPPEATAASDAAPAAEPPKPKEEAVSPQLALLARKERALRAEAQKLKAEREAWKREQEQARQPQQSFDPSKYVPKDRLTDPMAALEALSEVGLTYDQLTQAALNAPSPESLLLKQTISKLEAKISQLEESNVKTQKTFEERDQQSYQQALRQIDSEAKAIIDSDPQFEMTKATGQHNEVTKLVESVWKEEQRLMSVEEAAKLVEDQLVEEYLKYSKVGKIQKRLQPAPAAPAQAKPTASQSQQSQPKTLTNAVTSAPKMDRVARAKAAFNGQKF